MNRLKALAAIPLFAGFMWAQSDQPASAQRQVESKTTTTESSSWNGTLVDASCRTNTAHRESTETSRPDADTTKTTKTTSSSTSTECPLTTTTKTFGVMTEDGKVIAFDEPSNMKVVEVMKSNKDWSKNLDARQPVKVRVVGNQRGDVIVVESIK